MSVAKIHHESLKETLAVVAITITKSYFHLKTYPKVFLCFGYLEATYTLNQSLTTILDLKESSCEIRHRKQLLS